MVLHKNHVALSVFRSTVSVNRLPHFEILGVSAVLQNQRNDFNFLRMT